MIFLKIRYQLDNQNVCPSVHFSELNWYIEEQTYSCRNAVECILHTKKAFVIYSYIIILELCTNQKVAQIEKHRQSTLSQCFLKDCSLSPSAFLYHKKYLWEFEVKRHNLSKFSIL